MEYLGNKAGYGNPMQSGGLSAGAAQCEQPIRDASQMQVAAKRHADALTRLDHLVSLLCNKLEPILRPSIPTPSATGGQLNKQAEMQAPLAAGLHQITDQMEHLNSRVDDVLNRLEL